jgi:acetate kinase
MSDAILVINAGSSSIEFSLFGADPQGAQTIISNRQVEGIGVHPRFIAEDRKGETSIEQTRDHTADRTRTLPPADDT